jgi:hypothetical protein
MADENVAPLHIKFSRRASKTTLAGGAMMLLFAIVGLLVSFGGPGPATLATVVSAIGLLACVVIAIADLFYGMRRLLRPELLVWGPDPYADPNEIHSGMTTGRLTSLQNLPGRFRWLFGRNMAALSPVVREVVTANVDRMLTRVLVIAALLAICYGVAIGEWAGTDLLLPLVLLLIASVALAAVEYLTSGWLIPDGPPTARAHQSSEYYKGFGHPTHIFGRLAILANDLQVPGFPNRVQKWNETEEGGSLQDVGKFTGTLFVERQPLIMDNEDNRSAFLLLYTAWGLRCVGTLLFAFAIAPPTVANASPRIYVLLTAGVALLFLHEAQRFRTQATFLLSILQFRSVGVLLSMAGDMTKASVRVGRAMTDSLESENVTTRSNFTGQFWAAELISEARHLAASRHLLLVRPTEEALKWLETLQTGLRHLRDERVRPMGIDLASDEASDLARVNQLLYKDRMRAPVARASLPEIDAFEPPLLSAVPPHAHDAPDGSVGPDDEMKECPECAEKIRARAKKCRFCGFRFDEVAIG